MSQSNLSARAEAVTRRTYNRPLDDEGKKFETWVQTIRRAQVEHHRILWNEALKRDTNTESSVEMTSELSDLYFLGIDRKALVSGRTLWLGGTPYAYSRAASQFNCAGLEVATVFDLVDAFWLLLNGCGVGAIPRAGTLHGYHKQIDKLKIVASTNDKDFRGKQENTEDMPCVENNHTWTIKIGDSATSWAKAIGKMFISPKSYVRELVLDFSEIRGAGGRLKGYGWICNGYKPLADAMEAIHGILNESAGTILDEQQIGDVINWAGTILSSRRAAEALCLDSHHPRRDEFSTRKFEYWKTPGQPRRQSNNSLLFWQKPSLRELEQLLEFNFVGGEPGFVNAAAAVDKCPWFRIFNPCFEIMLASHGFCNLASVALPLFNRNYRQLERAVYLIARANYRQTCVNLEDGILQPRWHQTNESLRLCGVSLTGICQADWLTNYQIRQLRNTAILGAYSMADELGLPRPKAVCTIKPEGTRSKITGRDGMEIGEGMHRPLGRFLFNWINFSTKDPLVEELASKGYKVIPSPSDPNNVLVRFPVEYSGCKFDKVNGKEVNLEPATEQLARYLRWNRLWADHNVSATINFDREEIPALARMIYDNWDSGYIATAFLPRVDPTKTALDYGHPYLPQEVIMEEDYREAMSLTRPIDWERFHTGVYEINDASDCPGGVCPVK